MGIWWAYHGFDEQNWGPSKSNGGRMEIEEWYRVMKNVSGNTGIPNNKLLKIGMWLDWNNNKLLLLTMGMWLDWNIMD